VALIGRFRTRVPSKMTGSLSLANCCLCASSSPWIVSRSIPVVAVGSWTTARFRQEEHHVHGDQLQLHRSKGHLQSFVLDRGDRTRKSHGMSTDSEHVSVSTVAQQPVPIALQRNQSSFQSYSSGVSTASYGMKLDTVSLSSAAEPTVALIIGR